MAENKSLKSFERLNLEIFLRELETLKDPELFLDSLQSFFRNAALDSPTNPPRPGPGDPGHCGSATPCLILKKLEWPEPVLGLFHGGNHQPHRAEVILDGCWCKALVVKPGIFNEMQVLKFDLLSSMNLWKLGADRIRHCLDSFHCSAFCRSRSPLYPTDSLGYTGNIHQ